MQLYEYLKSNDISFSDFAQQIGAKSRATVYRYINGTRKIPSRAMMDKIMVATGGAVTIADFYDLPIDHQSSKENIQKKPNKKLESK